MPHLKLFAIQALFFLSLMLSASTLSQADPAADPYNTYLWNRSNALAGNGKVKSGDWFEWWYYKVVIPETDEAFLFTYGIVNPWDVDHSRPGTNAFVSVASYADNQLIEGKFPVTEFKARHNETFVEMGPNLATDRVLQGELQNQDGATARWNLKVERAWNFNAMGWAMFIKSISNIFWYPAQASARMTGWIDWGARHIEVRDAPAYQDRNWGKSFPRWWVWLVSNHFKDAPDTALAAGGGQPRVFDRWERVSGLCIGFKHKGKEHTFRIGTGDPMRFEIHFGKWNVRAWNKRGYKIEISAFAPKEKFIDLPFTTPEGKVFHDYEALKGQMRVKLYRRVALLGHKRWKLLADVETDEAGIEYGAWDQQDMNSIFSQKMRLQ